MKPRKVKPQAKGNSQTGPPTQTISSKAQLPHFSSCFFSLRHCPSFRSSLLYVAPLILAQISPHRISPWTVHQNAHPVLYYITRLCFIDLLWSELTVRPDYPLQCASLDRMEILFRGSFVWLPHCCVPGIWNPVWDMRSHWNIFA